MAYIRMGPRDRLYKNDKDANAEPLEILKMIPTQYDSTMLKNLYSMLPPIIEGLEKAEADAMRKHDMMAGQMCK